MTVQIPVDQEKADDFCQCHHMRRLALFGSVLRADFGPQRDIDVLVEFQPEHVPGFRVVDVQNDLAKPLGRPVDLNTPGFLSPYIRDRIEREALVLCDASR
jgi:predicted nucleotidyltransferase